MCVCVFVCVGECEVYYVEGLTSKPLLICVIVHFSLLFTCTCVYLNTPVVQFKNALLFLIGHGLCVHLSSDPPFLHFQ